MSGEDGGDRSSHFVLDGKDILERAVVVLGPAVGPRRGIDQLGGDANTIANTPYAAFEQVAHAQIAPNLADIGRLAFVLEARVAGDDKQLGEARQLRDDVVHDAIDQIFLLRMQAHIVEREHGNRGFIRKRRRWCRHLLRCGRRHGVIQQNAVDVHRMVNILELVLTNILEGDAEPAETALRVFLHAARYADTASFRQRLQPGRDVDAIAMDAGAFDNIADVDPHPKFDSSF
jgi:hypothetical protein